MKIFSILLIWEIKYLYCLSLLQLICCLYKDQAEKIDSKQRHIGKVKFAYIDPLIAGTHKFVVATDENVMACLSTENGSIIWGHNLQKVKLGEIDALSEEGDLITVNDGGQFLGSWDPITGELLWEIEKAFPHPQNSRAVSYFKINTLSEEIIKIEILPKKHAKVYICNYAKATLKTSDIIDVSVWFDEDTKCNFFSSNYFICVEPDRKVLQLLSVKEMSAFKPVHLSSLVGGNSIDISDLDGKITKLISVPFLDSREDPIGIFQLDNSIIFLDINPLNLKMISKSHVVKYTSTLITLVDIHQDKHQCFILFSVSYTGDRYDGNNIYEAQALIGQGYHCKPEDIAGLKGKYSVPEHRGELMKAFILPDTKKDHGINYKLLLLFEDNSILLYHQKGQLIWSREEVPSKDQLKVHHAWSDEL